MTTYDSPLPNTPRGITPGPASALLLNLSEASNLLRSLEESSNSNPMTSIVLGLVLSSGLRRRHLLSLRLEDIGSEAISLSRGLGERVLLPCSPILLGKIKSYRGAQSKGPLLRCPGQLDSCLRNIRKAALLLGIQKPITWSNLRKAYFGILLRSGASIGIVRAIAGATTSRMPIKRLLTYLDPAEGLEVATRS